MYERKREVNKNLLNVIRKRKQRIFKKVFQSVLICYILKM